MKKHSRATVADLLAMKGSRQLTMLRVTSLAEAEAAETAGIDIVSVPPALLGPAFREAAPTPFAIPGLEYGDYVSAEEYMREAFKVLKAGGDAVYCAAGLPTIRRMREEGIPVCGHVGLIPSKATWTGGFRAVGKTVASALEVWRQTKALEEAGAFAVEIEVVPAGVAEAISRNTSMLTTPWGREAAAMRSIFLDDVLGSHGGHYPRHAKKYRNFAVEYERLQRERIAAFSEFAADVRSGAYPERQHLVSIEDGELQAFLRLLADGDR
ncbi:3-methyl-2-oxobutanoate hydroxymethyltransferase [Rhizobium rhizogenes]